jgi:hypothetical protein
VWGGGGSMHPGNNNMDNKEASPQDSDEEQGLRWLNFMTQQAESDDNLLRAMELIEDNHESG